MIASVILLTGIEPTSVNASISQTLHNKSENQYTINFDSVMDHIPGTGVWSLTKASIAEGSCSMLACKGRKEG